MRFAVSLVFLVFWAGTVAFGADQATRELQAELQALGFYYGTVDGEAGPETQAALRRYQIRNGLPVTGVADEETLYSLRKGGLASIEPKRKPQTATADGNLAESDREFLERENGGAQPNPSVAPGTSRDVRPPATFGYRDRIDSGNTYADIFAGGPLERASLRTKQIVIARAQVVLRRYQFYGGAIDGIPGNMTTQAILDFQRSTALRMTGRLDELTLRELGLWRPDRRYGWGEYPEEPGREVYRGHWIR